MVFQLDRMSLRFKIYKQQVNHDSITMRPLLISFVFVFLNPHINPIESHCTSTIHHSNVTGAPECSAAVADPRNVGVFEDGPSLSGIFRHWSSQQELLTRQCQGSPGFQWIGWVKTSWPINFSGMNLDEHLFLSSYFMRFTRATRVLTRHKRLEMTGPNAGVYHQNWAGVTNETWWENGR